MSVWECEHSSLPPRSALSILNRFRWLLDHRKDRGALVSLSRKTNFINIKLDKVFYFGSLAKVELMSYSMSYIHLKHKKRLE